MIIHHLCTHNDYNLFQMFKLIDHIICNIIAVIMFPDTSFDVEGIFISAYWIIIVLSEVFHYFDFSSLSHFVKVIIITNPLYMGIGTYYWVQVSFGETERISHLSPFWGHTFIHFPRCKPSSNLSSWCVPLWYLLP